MRLPRAPVSVLNVDDYAPSRFLRSRILERAGYEVREAESAEQAIASCLSGKPPRLILLDIALPDGDGFSVCERVKAVSGDIPVVMITSVYRTAQARRDGFAAGALLVMLIDSMIPEAQKKAGNAAGLITVLGFAVAAALSQLA